MSSKIKNIIILVVVAVVLILVYIFFIKKAPDSPSLTSSSGSSATATEVNGNNPSTEVSDLSSSFISLLLSVKSIKLDDSILTDQTFLSLKDSSITLVQDGNEGRTNPFAPIGTEDITPLTTPTTPTTPTTH